MKWTLDTVAAALSRTGGGGTPVDAVVTDSRDATSGALFVALRGENADGNDYIRDAMTRGASGAIASIGRLPDGVPGFEVGDTLVALRVLGEARRGELSCPVVAITGSTGKTTTKDFTAAVLGPGAFAAPRSFNNEIGVPLTVLACPDDADALVLEVGSRGVGHIADLASVVAPDVAVITNIGPAHLEMFGDVATVRRAKSELIAALSPEGVAVLPAVEATRVDSGGRSTITFGEDEGADIDIAEVAVDATGRASFMMTMAGSSHSVRLEVPGRHQPRNAAAAVAAAVGVGVDLDLAVSRLGSVRLSPWRMEVSNRRIDRGRITVVNDAYNANPTSMASALETVAAMPGRHIAVLGMMHELGDGAEEFHHEVGRTAAKLGFAVVTVGDDPGIATGAGKGARSVADLEGAREAVVELAQPGDVVLIKASRAAGLEQLAAMIGEEAS